jgi:serine O-acetyltransferase
MFESVRADLLRAQGCAWEGPRRAIHTLVNSYGLQALLVYRLGRWLREARRHPWRWLLAPLLWPTQWLLSGLVRTAYDIRLDSSADIGPGLLIHHFAGIRLRACRLGTNCVIHHEVHLEPAADGQDGPQLGDRVWVGPHARILGQIRVGRGATVGAGAVVRRDVAENALVLGNPASVARSGYDNSSLP